MTDCGCLLQHARAIQLPLTAPKKMAWKPFSKSFEILAPRRSRSYAKSLKLWQRKCTPALLPLELAHSKCCQPLLINFLLGTSRLSGSAFLFCHLWTFCSTVYFFIQSQGRQKIIQNTSCQYSGFSIILYSCLQLIVLKSTSLVVFMIANNCAQPGAESGRPWNTIHYMPYRTQCRFSIHSEFLVLLSLRSLGFMWDKYPITICEKVFISLWTCGCGNIKHAKDDMFANLASCQRSLVPAWGIL